MAISGLIRYCPELRLYSYSVKDHDVPDGQGDSELKFDDDELENVIASHLGNGRKSEAEFMTYVTGLARINPHKFIQIKYGKDDFVIEAVLEPAVHWQRHDAERDAEYKVDEPVDAKKATKPKTSSR